jgi:hypothetical protein
MLAEFSSLVPMDSVLCQVVVAVKNGFVAFAKLCGEFFDHMDRAMLAAGTSDGNGQIPAMRLFEAGNPAIEETDDVFKHRGEIFLLIQKIDYVVIESGQSA